MPDSSAPPAEPATDATEAETQPDMPADTEQTDTGQPGAEAEVSANSEAARYRTRLRESEAVRDALAQRLTGYQRRECEALVGDLLEQPGDLWNIGGADQNAFYGEDGSLDTAELRAAAGALIDQRPRLAAPARPSWSAGPNSTAGQQVPGGTPTPTSWGQVIGAR